MTALQTLLRWISTACVAVLVVSFALFAIEQADAESDEQIAMVENISQPSPTPETEREREAEHGDVREAIDDAADLLLEPFAGVVDSDSIWAERGVATLLALVVFGFLLRLVAGYIPGRR